MFAGALLTYFATVTGSTFVSRPMGVGDVVYPAVANILEFPEFEVVKDGAPLRVLVSLLAVFALAISQILWDFLRNMHASDYDPSVQRLVQLDRRGMLRNRVVNLGVCAALTVDGVLFLPHLLA